MDFAQNRLLIAFVLLSFSNVFISGFDYGREKIRGVNIGGWLVLEPWITPSLFNQFVNKPEESSAVDEYTFTKYLGREEASRQLNAHWNSFVTENDFKRLRESGINHVRIPIGYWIFGGLSNEPWINGSFPYLLKGIEWAKKHDLKVVVDMHCAPGSQNGFDNSGKRGAAEWFNDEGAIHRVKDILVALAIIFNQPDYANTVTAIELINEPANWLLNLDRIKQFYIDTYYSIRAHNKNINLIVHDAFRPTGEWKHLGKSPYEKVILDTHIYQVFTPEFTRMSQSDHLKQPCSRIGELNDINSNVWTVVGEWTLATDDCALWLNGFKRGSRYEGTYESDRPACLGCKCSVRNDPNTYNNDFMKKYAMQQIGVYEQFTQGWFFWNFKTESSPNWDFLFAVDKGWINLKVPQLHQC